MAPGAKVAINVVLGLLAVFLLFCLGCLFPLDFAFSLIAGWVFYLVRVAPQITWNWSGIFTAVVCLVILAFGLQRFLSWFYRQLQTKRGTPAPKAWSWKWTLRILGLVVLMFVAGLSAIGITHQTAWLITSPGPLLEGGMREPVYRTQSANNLHQIGLACHNYHDTFKQLPPGGTFDPEGHMLHGWQTMLLPYLEEDAVYNQINLRLPWTHPDNAAAFQKRIPSYLNPGVDDQQDHNGFYLTHYSANVRVIGGNVPRSFKDIPDGTANTILGGEVAGNFKPCGYPANWRDPAQGINKTPNGFGGPWNSKGVNFVFADGSVRFIKEDIDPATLKALSTPDGGETINWDDL